MSFLSELLQTQSPVWFEVLKCELDKDYFLKLSLFLEKEYASSTPVYPPKELVFHAFQKTPYQKVNVVILGQDPYIRAGQAEGLCFSVPKGTAHPPSLQNIYKELAADLGKASPLSGSLHHWAQQGVLLLNTTLTVSAGRPLSHHKRGWERLTDVVIQKLAENNEPLVFILWGNHAQKKVSYLVKNQEFRKVLLLKTAHPSPLSAFRGFFGSHPFSKTNQFLISQNKREINWI